jgi:hypothetical protein
MSTRLKNLVTFIAVPVGVPTTLPHGLTIPGVGSIRPDIITVVGAAAGQFTTITATATDVTVTNSGPAAADVQLLCEWWHTIERAFGGTPNVDLQAGPIIVNPGASESAFTFSLGGFRDGLVANDAGKQVLSWIPPSLAQITKFAVATNVALAAGIITMTLVSLNLDNLGAGPTVISTLTLDSTHSDRVATLATPTNPRQLIAVLADANGAIIGGHLVVASVSGGLA